MTLEQALRLTNRNMIAFDLVLGSRRAFRARGDAEGDRPRASLSRRRTPLPPRRADLAHLRRRPRWSPSTAASRATGGRLPGCAAPRSPPMHYGPSPPLSAAQAPSSAFASRASPMWRWPRASPGSRGSSALADLAGLPRQALEPARHHRRGRRGLADPRHLAQALPLPFLSRRDRDRQRARRRPVRLPARRHRTPPLAPPLRRRAAWSAELGELRRVPTSESATVEARATGAPPSGRRRQR